MIQISKYSDVICLQLNQDWYRLVDASLKKQVDQLAVDLQSGIISGVALPSLATKLHSAIFNLRIVAMRWIFDHEIDLNEEMRGFGITFLSRLGSSKPLASLGPILQEALNINRQIIKGIITQREHSQTSPALFFRNMPKINYDEFIHLLALSIPDESLAQKFIDWLHISLNIEFTFFATNLIMNELDRFPTTIIDDLTEFAAITRDQYAALARELGLIPIAAPKKSLAGAFQSDLSAEQLVEEVRQARYSNRITEEL